MIKILIDSLFIRFLISILLSLHIHHLSFVNGQDGGVTEPSKAPSLPPTPAPTDDYPKSYQILSIY